MTIGSGSRVAVIGAGISGVTTAYVLLKRGCIVSIFDKHPYAAMETSYANGGQLSASNAEVWNSWSNVGKGLRWMFSPTAPLLINPKVSLHKLSWLAEFVAAIRNYEDNTIATARLAIEARRHLLRIAEDENIQFDCERRGILHVYRSKTEFDEAAKVTKLLSRAGLERHAVSAADIRSIEPALKGDYFAGFFTPSDFSGDIHKFTNELMRACERLGVERHTSTEVTRISPDADHVDLTFRSASVAMEGNVFPAQVRRFDRVVVCAGVMSGELARQCRDRINVYPVKGYSITLALEEQSDQDAAPWVSLLDDRAKIVASRLARNRYRVAGTAEFNGFNHDIRADRIAPLVAWCRENFPNMSTRGMAPWAGLRPMMPDMLPRVMHGKNPRVIYNTGHGHLGWTLSAATAEYAGDLALVNAG